MVCDYGNKDVQLTIFLIKTIVWTRVIYVYHGNDSTKKTGLNFLVFTEFNPIIPERTATVLHGTVPCGIKISFLQTIVTLTVNYR